MTFLNLHLLRFERKKKGDCWCGFQLVFVIDELVYVENSIFYQDFNPGIPLDEEIVVVEIT